MKGFFVLYKIEKLGSNPKPNAHRYNPATRCS
jgi:hypothetical protein